MRVTGGTMVEIFERVVVMRKTLGAIARIRGWAKVDSCGTHGRYYEVNRRLIKAVFYSAGGIILL